MKDLPDTPRRRCCLRYQHGVDQAPVVVAAGQGTIADKIVTIAQNIMSSLSGPRSGRTASTVDLGRSIPTDLYKAVAEILDMFIQ